MLKLITDWQWWRRGRGWQVSLLLVIILPLLLWLIQPLPPGPLSNLEAGLILLAKAAGFIGFGAFAWSLLIGARLHFIDRLFAGLDQAYRAHRWFGGLSLGAIVLHALSISADLNLKTPT